jgi:hypothetical protein
VVEEQGAKSFSFGADQRETSSLGLELIGRKDTQIKVNLLPCKKDS